MDIKAIMKIKKAWGDFSSNHPKFPGFISALRARGIHEGDIIAVSVTGPDGKSIETNLRVTKGDLELFNTLKELN